MVNIVLFLDRQVISLCPDLLTCAKRPAHEKNGPYYICMKSSIKQVCSALQWSYNV